MGVTTTPRLGLVKPDDDESAEIEVINGNMDVVDGAIGPSIVGTVAEISDPFNGQIARELDNDRTLMFINGVWLYVAVGDANSSNPNRIRLPNNALNDIDDTTNAFQIGPDTADNLAMDQDRIQSRNNGAADALLLNPYGGDVRIGTGGTPIIIKKEGIKAEDMQSQESSDAGNISISSTSYVTGGTNVEATVNCPPSGRILILLSTRCSCATSGGSAFVSYEATRISNGNHPVSPGADGNTIQNKASGANDANNVTTTIVDMVKGLVAGENYKFQVQHKKDAGGTSASIDFRKIVAIPMM